MAWVLAIPIWVKGGWAELRARKHATLRDGANQGDTLELKVKAVEKGGQRAVLAQLKMNTLEWGKLDPVGAWE